MTDSTKPKYLTVVFAINSDEGFAAMRKQIFDNFKQNEGEPWTVSAVSQDHEIRRVELMEQAAERDRFECADAIERLASWSDVGNVPSLDVVLSA